jgi:hypothetical protein
MSGTFALFAFSRGYRFPILRRSAKACTFACFQGLEKKRCHGAIGFQGLEFYKARKGRGVWFDAEQLGRHPGRIST